MEQFQYSDVHRMFLQVCTNEGIIEKTVALTILDQIVKKLDIDIKINNKFLSEVVSSINELLTHMNQKLVFLEYELDSKNYIVFSSESVGNIKSVLIGYSPQDLQYCRLLLESLSINPKHCISGMEAINLITEIKPKSILSTRADQLLKNWCDIGYFYEKEGLYYFGPRCLVEFNYYLTSNYKDYINNCSICNTTVFWGTCCKECDEMYHSKCMTKYLKKFKHCPSCNKQLNTSL